MYNTLYNLSVPSDTICIILLNLMGVFLEGVIYLKWRPIISRLPL